MVTANLFDAKLSSLGAQCARQHMESIKPESGNRRFTRQLTSMLSQITTVVMRVML